MDSRAGLDSNSLVKVCTDDVIRGPEMNPASRRLQFDDDARLQSASSSPLVHLSREQTVSRRVCLCFAEVQVVVMYNKDGSYTMQVSRTGVCLRVTLMMKNLHLSRRTERLRSFSPAVQSQIRFHLFTAKSQAKFSQGRLHTEQV